MQLFTNSQLKRFSSIFDNAGQVLLGSLVFGPMLNTGNFEYFYIVVPIGLCMTLMAWWIALKFERISA